MSVCIFRNAAPLAMKIFGKTRSFLFFATLLLSENGFPIESVMPCQWNDAKCGYTEHQKHALRQSDAWQVMLSKPLHERVGIGDKNLVFYTALDNIANGYSEKPRLAETNDTLLRELIDVIKELPDVVKLKLAPKLAGVMLVENFGGTGMSQYVYGLDGEPIVGFIVLDPVALTSCTANSWATWKENSPFRPDPSIRITANIEDKENDTRKNAIRYIVLHEIAHILSIGERFHPLWTRQTVSAIELVAFPFARVSWQPMPARLQRNSKFDGQWPERKNIIYYFGAKLDGQAAIPAYQQLATTTFPTLYAATNWADDFAESFVNYIHVVITKRPFEIRIERDGALASSYRACWEEARCSEKRKIIEAYLQKKGT
ncbi:MAG: hypothetical protein WCL29_03555 [Pseudomonadota bacterium]